MSILSIDNKKQLQLDTQNIVGRSIAVLGITGSGKTNTAAVLIEELLANGFPLTIVDIEGEYWGLKERFEILVVGRSKNVDVKVGPEHAAHLAELSVQKGISIILDMSDFTQDEMFEFLLRYFKMLWQICSTTRQPYEVVLEEAHEFIPQGIRTDLKEILTRIALRGRKRGLGMILMSQRSAKVEKDVLTQTSLLFLHRVIHPIDLKIYKELIPLPSREVEEMVGSLQPGQAIVLYNHEAKIVQIRLRDTFHAGATPSLTPSAMPNLRKIDKTVLAELKKLTAQKGEANDEQSKFAKQLKELEETLKQKDAEIERLQMQIGLLSNLKLSLESLPKAHSSSNPPNLQVKQANVDKLIVGDRQNGTKPERLAVAETKTAYTIQPEVLLTSPDQIKLESIIRRIQKLPKMQKAILRLLVEHREAAMTAATMASWLGLQESTIRSKPPQDLLKMKLVSRTRNGRRYTYKSSVKDLLRTNLSDTQVEIAIALLLNELD